MSRFLEMTSVLLKSFMIYQQIYTKYLLSRKITSTTEISQIDLKSSKSWFKYSTHRSPGDFHSTVSEPTVQHDDLRS